LLIAAGIDVDFWLLIFICWLLIIDFWLVFVGRWLVATGYWLLVIGLFGGLLLNVNCYLLVGCVDGSANFKCGVQFVDFLFDVVDF